jgi:hypothetical protein
MISSGGPLQWVDLLLQSGSRKEKRKKLEILFSFWWMIWKERNKRIFEHVEISASQLGYLIQEVISMQLSVLAPQQPGVSGSVWQGLSISCLVSLYLASCSVHEPSGVQCLCCLAQLVEWMSGRVVSGVL